ncbi:trypsin domain-containing protein [Ditylenchus destructor]|uniref:Trypsin domain-containing protein n=1 Tax=Ditylenchus destructor TaxID=166010 RepID=A0AAD4MEN6_9BILA|nr:trypsin domain-containing protein [Ditylenchus destructor]
MRIFLLLHLIIIYVERFLSQTPSEKLAETNCFARCGIMEPAMTPAGKVIGGHTSTGSSYPWETHIQGVFECGGHKPIEISSTGFVIDPKVILTTAHSMFYETKLIKEACPIPGFIFDEFVEPFAPKWTQFQPNEVKVYIGAVTMGDIQQGNSTVVEVEKIIIREGFNMRGTDQLYAYDLAALILKEPLELGPKLRKVCIPDATFSETKGSMAHLSGWDKYKTNSATSNKVSEFRDETSVPYESTDICNV